MAIRVKDTATIARKFVVRAGAASADYKTGVEAAGQDWATNTEASEDIYEAGVQSAIGDKRFGKGVREAGAAKYVGKASTLGASRFGPGVQAAEGAYAKGVAPFLDVIKGLTLPPRRPKGDPANYARAQFVGEALRAAKLAR